MANPNKKVKRPDGLGKIYKYKTDGDGKILALPVKKILKDNYIYLYRAISHEGFYIGENDTCFFFKEILYDNEVVGFAAYRASNFSNESLIMQYIYILPDYRNKGLFVEELDESANLFESSILIEYPNRFIVETLIKHKLARVFDGRYVISKIPFIMPMVSQRDAASGVLREDYCMADKKGYRKMSLIYDLDLCAVVGLSQSQEDAPFNENDIENNEDLNNCNVLSLPLKIDNENFDCINKRMEDSSLKDGSYFNKVREIVDSQDEIIQNWLSIL